MLSKNIRLLPLFIQQLLHMLMMEKIIKKNIIKIMLLKLKNLFLILKKIK